MRVLLLTWACDLEDVSEPGVAARWVQELSRDHEVTVFAVSKPSRFGCVREQFPELDVIEWCDIRLPQRFERFQAIVKPGYFPYYFKARRFLRRLLAERQFDVIHHLNPFTWRYPSPAAGLGVPLVRGPLAGGLPSPSGFVAEAVSGASPFMLLRGSDGLRARFDPWLRRSYALTDHVLMAAPYVAERLRHFTIRSASVEIELGLSGEPAQEATPPSGDPTRLRLLYVGRIIPTKGLLYAIRALGSCVRRDEVTLTVVGDGDYTPRCREEVARLGLSDRVHFLGWRDRAEVEAQYRQADVFIFPSFREPTGGVLLEAMAAGLPIITCAYGGPDYVVDESCGVKVAPTSPEELVQGLAQAIDRLAADARLRAAMAAAARARAVAHFDWAGKRQRLAALYRQLAAPVAATVEEARA